MTKSHLVINEAGQQLGIYSEDGRMISTHSMLKTFRRCPKQAEYKYVHRLKPKALGKPLKKGTWMHSLLEAYYKGEDWMAVHTKLSRQFNQMFDEEKDFYGNLPEECLKLMESYLWHYRGDTSWKVVEVEFVLECELPDGSIYRGRVDMLVETPFGLYIVDHKNMRSLPDHGFRLLDGQSALYLWAALKSKLPVQGFIWNYLRTKAPSVPKLAYEGKAIQRLSTRSIETDYPTYVNELQRLKKEKGLGITAEYKAYAESLKKQRYQHGEPQLSPFFRRDTLEKQNSMLRRVATENFRTHKRMHSYDYSNRDAVERVVERSCNFSCSYTDLCTVELMGGNTRPLIKQNYQVGDPMDYYYDDKAPEKGDA
jgi:hypothetical protein